MVNSAPTAGVPPNEAPASGTDGTSTSGPACRGDSLTTAGTAAAINQVMATTATTVTAMPGSHGPRAHPRPRLGARNT